ncbi:MAG: polyphosphate kinase 1 [Bacteroidales bacterium]|nr:polyphosphate kinase 1 [Bacteroidales bacterium]MCF8391927.1 polyphosphate kinase 1 [Bacteroidales bacterium]
MKINIQTNRELSWLSFNERVLQEAADSNVPLVERMKFLGIFSNNLDEFFKVRVATIKRMIDIEESTGKYSKERPSEILNQIQEFVIHLQQKFEEIYKEVKTELEKEKISIIDETQLTRNKAEFVQKYFEEKVLPVLTPVMLHNVKKFPQLKDRSIYLAVIMTSEDPEIEKEYAVIEIPTERLGRFLLFPIRTRKYIILLDDVIRFGLKSLFSQLHYDHYAAYTIKLTRDAELDIDNDLSKSFLEKIDESVSGRRKGQPVRLVYDKTMPKELLVYIIQRLDLEKDDNMIPGGRYHNFKDFMNFPNLGKAHLQYPQAKAINHPRFLLYKSVFDVISEKDVLLHFPYQNFNHYINWLREASMDPNVVSVKTTLYRVASDSAVMNALINAALNGKQVTVNIELQARFDEKLNIYWSRQLEEAGVRVTFGIPGLKVHSKITLISRRESGEIVHYSALGTGNFHEGTAKVYSDILLITKDQEIGAEIWKVFDFIDNPYKNYKYDHLIVSPNYQREKLSELIRNEIINAEKGEEAYIILKVNSLVDKEMIEKLYQANNAGVKIRAIVRGICTIVPGVEGMSENIEVVSIVDKFLEHSRVFIFANGGDELYYLSSADWMPRNIDNRIEVSAPVYDKDLQRELRYIIDLQLADNVKARIIDEDDLNKYKGKDGKTKIRSQIELYEYFKNLK